MLCCFRPFLSYSSAAHPPRPPSLSTGCGRMIRGTIPAVAAQHPALPPPPKLTFPTLSALLRLRLDYSRYNTASGCATAGAGRSLTPPPTLTFPTLSSLLRLRVDDARYKDRQQLCSTPPSDAHFPSLPLLASDPALFSGCVWTMRGTRTASGCAAPGAGPPSWWRHWRRCWT